MAGIVATLATQACSCIDWYRGDLHRTSYCEMDNQSMRQ